jgi:hypothetical protein
MGAAMQRYGDQSRRMGWPGYITHTGELRITEKILDKKM